jgi:hypothetical protein
VVSAHSKAVSANADIGIGSLEDLIASFETSPLKDDEITIGRMSARTGRTEQFCQFHLLRLFRCGKMTRRPVIVDGRRMYAYKIK